MTEAMSVKPLFAAMPLSLNKEAAKAANTVYQFDLTGEGGGQFIVTIRDGECNIEEGIHRSPDVTISAAASDYMQIATGTYPFGLAYINGRLHVDGDLRLLVRMASYFAPSA
jgi:putative sterol carrier protein